MSMFSSVIIRSLCFALYKKLSKTEQVLGFVDDQSTSVSSSRHVGFDQPGDRVQSSRGLHGELTFIEVKSPTGNLQLHCQVFTSRYTCTSPLKMHVVLCNAQVQTLTQENLQLKARVADLERVIDPKVLEELDKNRTNVSRTGSFYTHCTPGLQVTMRQ